MTIIQSIGERFSPRYAKKIATRFAKNTAIVEEQTAKTTKKDYTKFDARYGNAPRQVWEYLHSGGERIMHASSKQPVIELNPTNISEEISDKVLGNIRCKFSLKNPVEDIDAAMGRYGLSMHSGIPLNEFCLSGGYVETPYKEGKSIAYSLREFLFNNREGYVQCIKDRFGKSGEIMLAALEKTGAVDIFQPPMNYEKQYRCCRDFMVDDKRYYGMPLLEKAFQLVLESAKK